MAAYSSIFAQTVEFDGTTWRLIYDPANPVMVKPDLSHSSVVSASCDPVSVGGSSQLYMVALEIVIPSQARGGSAAINERRLLAIRIYDYMPPHPGVVKPAEMLYYAAEPKFATEGNRAQALLNAILGFSASPAGGEASDPVDKTWGSKLLGNAPAGVHSDEEVS